MKKFFLVFIVFALASFLNTSCTSSDSETPIENETPEPLEAQTFLNVSYGNNSQQIYDIYLPENRSSSKTKVIILVHGGGWTEGDKTDMANFITLIKQYHPNHAIVNINYVLATTATPAFPNQFLDVQRVINKITAEKEELQILPEFGLIGTSAGAHISLMYDYVYDTSDAVKFVCDIVGPTNFTDPFYANNPNFALLLSLLVDENSYPAGTNYATTLSPALQVSGNSSPTILFYGNEDPLVPLTNGEALQDALINLQVTNSFTVYEGGHGDWNEASYVDLQVKLSAFINAHLQISP
jgi:acetyl esterase/lipase